MSGWAGRAGCTVGTGIQLALGSMLMIGSCLVMSSVTPLLSSHLHEFDMKMNNNDLGRSSS